MQFLCVQQFKSNGFLWGVASGLCRFSDWIGSLHSGSIVRNVNRQTVSQVAENWHFFRRCNGGVGKLFLTLLYRSDFRRSHRLNCLTDHSFGAIVSINGVYNFLEHPSLKFPNLPNSDIKLTAALKEWAVAIDALQQGKTIVLLRKGGIREQGGSFQVDRQPVVLYPTYEHQKPELLKSEYADKVTPVESGWHPETIHITAWAEITDILTVETDNNDDSPLSELWPFHIWRDRMIRDRLKWKPRQPLYLLLLRTYKLPQPQIISYAQDYGGCRSWIDLLQPISLQGSFPVLDDTQYQNSVTTIRQIINR